jgi:hypothetical protein
MNMNNNENLIKVIENSKKIYKELDKIDMTLINIKISVSKIQNEEGKVLSTIADYIDDAIRKLEDVTKENIKLIEDYNK